MDLIVLHNWLIIDFSAFVLLSLMSHVDNEEAGAYIGATYEQKEEILLKTPQDFNSTQEYVDHYFADDPVMSRVAWCESKYKHYVTEEEKRVLRGERTPEDIGVMQINEYYHGKTADELGIDIYTLEGNVAYARYLYEKEGVKPWKASEHCWSDHIAQR